MAIKSKIQAGRNELCPCKSGLKYKHCHGDTVKAQLCNKMVNLYMLKLIADERKNRGIDPYMYTCNSCGKGTDGPVKSAISTATPVLKCPDCGSTDLVKYVPPEPEENDEDNGVGESEKKSNIILES